MESDIGQDQSAGLNFFCSRRRGNKMIVSVVYLYLVLSELGFDVSIKVTAIVGSWDRRRPRA